MFIIQIPVGIPTALIISSVGIIISILALIWKVSSKASEISTKLNGLDYAQELSTQINTVDASEVATIPKNIKSIDGNLSSMSENIQEVNSSVREMDSKIDSVDHMSQSVSTIEESLNGVNLKDMEKAVWRLAWDEQESPPPGNSVHYTLEQSQVDVTISLASEIASQSITEALSQNIVSSFVSGKNLNHLESEDMPAVFEFLTIEYMGHSLEFDNSFDYSEGKVAAFETDELIEEKQKSDKKREETDEKEVAEKEIDLDDNVEEDLMLSDAFDELDDPSELSEEFEEGDLGELEFKTSVSRVDITTVNFEFDEQINTHSVVGYMDQNERMAKKECRLFGHEGFFISNSPYEITYSIVSNDFEKIAELIDDMVDLIDEFNMEHKRMTDEFDATVEDRLE